jgi:medium-chain acyl-[acyl-carrier-protein] hydrolase
MQTSTANRFPEWTLVQPAIESAAFTLFCFPYAGAGATVFHGWRDRLPANVELCAIRLPGREARMREAPYTEMTALVATLLDVLRARLDGAYGFFGHSMGARIAFELTRAILDEKLAPPAQLWISGSRPPHLPRRPPVHHLPDDALVEELRRVHDLPDAIFDDPELRAIFLPIMRADLALHDTHVFRDAPPLPVPMSVYGGTDDPIVSLSDLAAWSVHTSAAMQVRTFPGRHLFLRTARAALLESLSQDLALWLPSPT